MGKKIRFYSIFRSFVFSSGTKSSENDRFNQVFVVCTGTKSCEKNGKKVEKKVFLLIYPGLESEFLIPKTLFMHLRPRLNSLEKKIVCIIYPGYQIRGLPVIIKNLNEKNHDFA